MTTAQLAFHLWFTTSRLLAFLSTPSIRARRPQLLVKRPSLIAKPASIALIRRRLQRGGQNGSNEFGWNGQLCSTKVLLGAQGVLFVQDLKIDGPAADLGSNLLQVFRHSTSFIRELKTQTILASSCIFHIQQLISLHCLRKKLVSKSSSLATHAGDIHAWYFFNWQTNCCWWKISMSKVAPTTAQPTGMHWCSVRANYELYMK